MTMLACCPSQEHHTHSQPFRHRTEQNVEHHWSVGKGHTEYLQCWKSFGDWGSPPLVNSPPKKNLRLGRELAYSSRSH